MIIYQTDETISTKKSRTMSFVGYCGSEAAAPSKEYLRKQDHRVLHVLRSRQSAHMQGDCTPLYRYRSRYCFGRSMRQKRALRTRRQYPKDILFLMYAIWCERSRFMLETIPSFFTFLNHDATITLIVNHRAARNAKRSEGAGGSR